MRASSRRDVAKILLAFSASALGARGGLANDDPQPIQSTRNHSSPARRTAAAILPEKPWLTLPPTPDLPRPRRSEVVEINGALIFYAQFGEGPSILLLHGGLANSSYWGHQIQALAAKFTVTVMDTRGHGRSPVPSGKFGFELFANDAVTLLSMLEIDSTSIVGWSDGAITGLQIAMTQPALITKLFAFGANGSVGGLIPGGSHSPVFATYAARCALEYKGLSPHPERWPQLLGGLGAMWRSQPNFKRREFAAIRSHTAIADGEYDEIIKRKHTEQMARDIPQAQLLIQPAVSHFAMLQNPTQFNKALARFLCDDS